MPVERVAPCWPVIASRFQCVVCCYIKIKAKIRIHSNASLQSVIHSMEFDTTQTVTMPGEMRTAETRKNRFKTKYLRVALAHTHKHTHIPMVYLLDSIENRQRIKGRNSWLNADVLSFVREIMLFGMCVGLYICVSVCVCIGYCGG